MENKRVNLLLPLQPCLFLCHLCEALLALSVLPLRDLTGRLLFCHCHRWTCRLADIRCREEVQDRLAALLVREEFCYLGATFAPDWAWVLLGLLQNIAVDLEVTSPLIRSDTSE